MLREISLSQARQRLPLLVHEMELNPEVAYRILAHKRAVAELKSPRPRETRLNAGAALLKLAAAIAKRRRFKRAGGPRVTSENYKEYLYGKNGVLGPRSRR